MGQGKICLVPNGKSLDFLKFIAQYNESLIQSQQSIYQVEDVESVKNLVLFDF